MCLCVSHLSVCVWDNIRRYLRWWQCELWQHFHLFILHTNVAGGFPHYKLASRKVLHHSYGCIIKVTWSRFQLKMVVCSWPCGDPAGFDIIDVLGLLCIWRAQRIYPSPTHTLFFQEWPQGSSTVSVPEFHFLCSFPSNRSCLSSLEIVMVILCVIYKCILLI